VFVNNLTAGLTLLPWVFSMPIVLDAPQWGMIAAFGVIQLAIPYLMFARALRGVSAHEAALLTIIEAVLNPFWVWLFIGEVAPASTWIGGSLIMTGLILRYTLFAPAAARNRIELRDAVLPVTSGGAQADE
jgi:drug/metabolite transporter (DMT)-like permease